MSAVMAIGSTYNKFQAWGDTHYVEGNGQTINNMQLGTFTLLKSQSGDLKLQATQVDGSKLGWPGTAMQVAAAIRMGGNTVSYDATSGVLQLNGKPLQLASGQRKLVAGNPATKIVCSGNQYTISDLQGDSVTFTRQNGAASGTHYLDISGQLDPNRPAGSVDGALGDFTGTSSTTNLELRDGQVTQNQDAFLNDWRTPDDADLLGLNPAWDRLMFNAAS